MRRGAHRGGGARRSSVPRGSRAGAASDSVPLLAIQSFDGYFTAVNPTWEKTLGYTAAELCATPYLELVHPEDRLKAMDEWIEHQALVDLNATLAHDIKNPLSVIVANYDYILEGYEGSADGLAALQDSRAAGQRILALLDKLVDQTQLARTDLER